MDVLERDGTGHCACRGALLHRARWHGHLASAHGRALKGGDKAMTWDMTCKGCGSKDNTILNNGWCPKCKKKKGKGK